MARRRRKKSLKPKKPRHPSRYFQCPRCGSVTLTIDFAKIGGNEDEKMAIAKCGNCHLYCELKVPRVLDRVDVYNKIVDLSYDNKLSECEKTESETEAETEEEVDDEGEI
ncbi:putative Zn ribbon-containing protein [Caldisphaera lagunensis DSM 15908]|uniref:Putative Zn ribbon-containing protein n=1 Tax=Caldisphaera lagunensis (strain DSM 15908 / JCM 11604 / ANMR 0165 / IC-154) TaxID=1056495 RepID=L0AB64_CALLD|nr:Zn ribbon-containing protein [Caldisphaera lagunensis]AFZ70290.1 putative Zn ribbon-containing protein [Caldisphaera lagunensis DSM 15908]